MSYETMGPMVRIPGKAAASSTFTKGALLAFDVDGFLAIPGGAATDRPAGVYTGHGVDLNTGSLVTGVGEHPEIEVEKGLVWVAFATAAQSDVGEFFYLADGETVTQTSGTNGFKLPCVGFKPGFVLLDFNGVVEA
jgi:hypothetical protein